ncbi:LysR family transcriptional regulator [Flexibacterium corallicola]|uniref:LysR family transcriptional regulator n=1 Tax=Flexibacterium corallicola TaxID=3037259 RepID=UPI00286F6BD8|nr:LysR family transcriptional regulator [Pseudovibrio sp. M1P-2-3]
MSGQIERIRIFNGVAKLGSFAKAARDLKVSRSIVTRYVSELEAELGVQLLVRTTRKVSLTTAGRLYLERTAPILEDLDRARDLVKTQHDSLRGTLRLSAPISFGQRFLPDILYQFQCTYPEVELQVDMTDRFVDLQRENYDMALRISGPPAGVSNIWRKILGISHCLVASPEYLTKNGWPDHPSMLKEHNILAYSYYSGGATVSLKNEGTGEQVKVPLHHGFETNSGDLLAALASRGAGMTFLPKFIIADELVKGSLVPCLEEWKAPEIWLTAYFPPYEQLPEKVSVFTGFVEDAVRAEESKLK